MFKQLAESFKSGTVTLTIQMEAESMAVMVTFKGINAPPKVLKGSPEEIEASFFTDLQKPLEIVSNHNDYLAQLEKEIAAQAAEKAKEAKVKEEDKKKVEAAKATQTSLLDAAPVEAPKPKTFPEKVAEKANEALNKPADATAAPVFEMPFVPDNTPLHGLSVQEVDQVLLELNADKTLGPWNVAPAGWAIVQRIKSCNEEQAREMFNAAEILSKYNVPQEEPEQNHAANVEALKAAIETPVIPAPAAPIVPPTVPGGFFTL